MMGLLGEGSACTQEPVGAAGQLTAALITPVSLYIWSREYREGSHRELVLTQSDLGTGEGSPCLTENPGILNQSHSGVKLSRVLSKYKSLRKRKFKKLPDR